MTSAGRLFAHNLYHQLAVCSVPGAANTVTSHLLGRQPIVDENAVKLHDLGPMRHKCRCCNALHFMHEKHSGKTLDKNVSFSQCCAHGKVVLPSLKPTPPVLNSLICKQRPGCMDFMKKIRSYSCAFQMASSGGDFDC